MNKLFPLKYLALGTLLATSACEEFDELELKDDVVPQSFLDIRLRPDDIYLYNNFGSETGSRLDPLLNDSIKVDVNVTYGTPSGGSIDFITNEGWFYKANEGFYGQDTFNYIVCHDGKCVTSTVTMHVEQPLTGDDCRYELIGESVTTQKDQPVEIRIFTNDIICPYLGNSVSKPEKGSFNYYSYSGSIKNTVYVYYPPKGYVGTDRFKYKIFTDGADMEAWCEITITN